LPSELSVADALF